MANTTNDNWNENWRETYHNTVRTYVTLKELFAKADAILSIILTDLNAIFQLLYPIIF